ncbi:MAG: histidinol dehydrogenase [Phycisphaerales bacterium]|nr:histidinol dehydrogenase [Phycisphaerales bacterium]
MSSTARLLRAVRPEDVPAVRRSPVEPGTLAEASAIVDDVRREGEAAVRRHAERLGDVPPGGALAMDRDEIERRAAEVPEADRAALERAAARIRAFAQMQRSCLRAGEMAVPGGRAGHTIEPVARAGCYAPGGRFPLPSSVLMTAVTARAAGVREVIVASPRPAPITVAAAAAAGADRLLCVGGAQAIGALAYGAGSLVAACDAVVGPGNRWVTAAKQLVAGVVAIDMLAGPSELGIIADDSADPAVVAADLLAQAEHDVDAIPVLVAVGPGVIGRVESALARQLATLPTAAVAARSLGNGFAVEVAGIEQAVAIMDRFAPEHLELMVRDAPAAAAMVRHAGAVFVGPRSAEVFGDYGAGPNHTLPTGGTARSAAGLSVLTFLRVRTYLAIDRRDEALIADTARLARLEGLEGHARSAEQRL